MTPRELHRRSNDRVTHFLKLLGIWCGAFLALGALLRSSWSIVDATVTAQHSFTSSTVAIQQISANQAAMTVQLQQMQAQLTAIVQHDSIQDREMSRARKHLADIDRVVTK
jgi:hypothetical protein